jgi:hypothetical protein
MDDEYDDDDEEEEKEEEEEEEVCHFTVSSYLDHTESYRIPLTPIVITYFVTLRN